MFAACAPNQRACDEFYCIQIGHWCDGVVNCPLGQDEGDAACNPGQTLVLLLGVFCLFVESVNILNSKINSYEFDACRCKPGEHGQQIQTMNIETITSSLTEVRIDHFVTIANKYEFII
ncbi:hypothetical protein ACTXT7_012918 [Hymenolepis weldensis]